LQWAFGPYKKAHHVSTCSREVHDKQNKAAMAFLAYKVAHHVCTCTGKVQHKQDTAATGFLTYKKAHHVGTCIREVQYEQDKAAVISPADTLAKPGAVVVHSKHTPEQLYTLPQ
jgi:hypothetical protein